MNHAKEGKGFDTDASSSVVAKVLEQRLLFYAVAAGAALASGGRAQAQIVFTPSNEVWISGGEPFSIDMNNDGTVDFFLDDQLSGCTSMTRTCFVYYGVHGAPGLSSNQVASKTGIVFGSEVALYRGAKVGPNAEFAGRLMVETGFSGLFGPWINVNHRYMGVKFVINGETHYGWIGFRSVTDSGLRTFEAMFGGWAYETQPNKPIRAGDTGTAEKSAASSGSADPTSLEMLATGHAANADWRQRKSY